MEQLTFRVYDAQLSYENDHSPIRFCCSSVREITLRQQIENGQLNIDPYTMVLIHETLDRNEARAMGTEF